MAFDTIFTVTRHHLDRLSPAETVDLVSRLLWAELRRIGLPTTNAHITARITTKDGGIDARVDPHPGVDTDDSFLSEGRSGLQIKAGTSFSPTEAQIRKELFGQAAPSIDALGDAVRACMDAGGTYILVCVGSDPSEGQVNQAELLLEALFRDCGYADPNVEVWGQSEIIGLLARFPSIALWVNGNGVAQFQTHSSWSGQIEMGRPFKAGERQLQFIAAAQTEMRHHDRAVHLRIRGEAGIGKTRLVLEALRSPDLAPLVVYCGGPATFLNGQLLNELLRDDNDFHVIAVVDECDRASYTNIWNLLGTRGPKIKFISIHNDIDEPSGSTVLLDVPPLEDAEISAVIQEYDTPRDHASRWAHYCDGSPRVAHVIGQNLKAHPDDVLKQPDTVDLWDRYVAGDDDPGSETVRLRRTVLRFLSLFKRFGYEGPVASEAQAVWRIINESFPEITWPRFQEIIRLLRDKKLLQGETTLYITPKLLHIKLWSEWFEMYGSDFDVGTFEAKLTLDLIEWFREMFRYARESRDAMKAVNRLLDETGPFRSADFFQHRGGAEFFLRLTDAAPDAALRRLEETFASWNADEFRSFEEGRRQVVWALERIAVWRDLFPGAARLLLRLAEGENEKHISNNATGVFADLFSPGQGPVAPTEAPPEERFPVLKEALEHESKECRKVALLACGHALQTGHFSRLVGAEHQGLRRQPELWMPKTWGELFDAYRRVWYLLRERLDHMPEDEQQQALEVMLNNARGLTHMANLASMVKDTLAELVTKRYVDNRQIIEVVETVLHYDAKGYEPPVREAWKKLQESLVTDDYHSLMMRYVGMDLLEDKFDDHRNHTDKAQPRIESLAQQAVDSPELLKPELAWLVTEDAKNGYNFGYSLGSRDETFSLLPALIDAQRSASKGASMFFLGGYFRALKERNEAQWEDQMDMAAADPVLRPHVPELTWRSGLTDRVASRILSLAKAGAVTSDVFRFFSYGGVIRQLSAERFAEWLDFLLGVGTQAAATCAVDLCHFYYLMRKPKVALPNDLVFRVLTAPALFSPVADRRNSTRDDYEWTEVARAYIEQHPERSVEIAALMLTHFREDGTIVGAFHSQTNKVLDDVLRRSPVKVWNIIAGYLGPPIDSRAFHIYHWLREGALALIPADSVWKWVEENVDKRAWYVANFVPQVFPGDPKSASAREVLVRYGSRKDVRNNLMANFSTEMWTGPESSHAQNKLDQLRNWKKGETNSYVLKWLDEYIASVDRRVERARIEEEREF